MFEKGLQLSKHEEIAAAQVQLSCTWGALALPNTANNQSCGLGYPIQYYGQKSRRERNNASNIGDLWNNGFQ